MIENPDEDATDPDEWEAFFKQFGPVAVVSVAKNNENLIWKVMNVTR